MTYEKAARYYLEVAEKMNDAGTPMFIRAMANSHVCLSMSHRARAVFNYEDQAQRDYHLRKAASHEETAYSIQNHNT